MRTKVGFLILLSSLFLFSACAEVETNPMVVQQVPKEMIGKWAYIGSIAVPGCDGVVNGVMTIERNGVVSFVEGKDSVCPGNFWTSWSMMTNSGIGSMKINKPENNTEILIAFGQGAVKITPVFSKKHLQILHLHYKNQYGIFKAVAIHL